MKPAALRLTLAGVLFAAWIGWLVYLVCAMKASVPDGGTRPIVLSRPQFLVSNLDVIADVQEIDTDPAEVTVREVLWPTEEEAKELVHKKITVSRLSECRDDTDHCRRRGKQRLATAPLEIRAAEIRG